MGSRWHHSDHISANNVHTLDSSHLFSYAWIATSMSIPHPWSWYVYPLPFCPPPSCTSSLDIADRATFYLKLLNHVSQERLHYILHGPNLKLEEAGMCHPPPSMSLWLISCPSESSKLAVIKAQHSMGLSWSYGTGIRTFPSVAAWKHASAVRWTTRTYFVWGHWRRVTVFFWPDATD